MELKRIISKMLVFTMMLMMLPASYARAEDNVKPHVIGGNISVNPIAGYSTEVDIDQSIEIEFSEEMDESYSGLLNSYAVVMYEIAEGGGQSRVDSITSYDNSTRKVTINPNESLKNGTTYRIILAEGYCKDKSGNSIVTNMPYGFQVYFSTAGAVKDIIPPVIIGSSPIGGQEGVPTDVSPLIIFNEAMDPSSINNTSIKLQTKASNGWSFVEVGVPYTVEYVGSTSSAAITIDGNLEEFKDHRITIMNTVKDVEGNVFEAQSIEFKTLTSDTEGPKVISTNIPDGEVDVAPEAKFKVTFDEEIKYDNYTLLIDIMKNGEKIDTSTYAPSIDPSSGSTALSIPASYSYAKWEKGAEYQIIVKPGFKDKFDNVSTETYTYTFTTVENDTTPPTITSMTPDMREGVTDNPTIIDVLRPEINIQFSERMPGYLIKGKYQTAVKLYESRVSNGEEWWTNFVDSSYNNAYVIESDTEDPVNFTKPFTSIKLTPTKDLTENTRYKLSLDVYDLQGNMLEKKDYYFMPKLSSGGDEDTIPPTVISSVPEKKEFLQRPTDIELDINPSVVLSEEINESTINEENVYITTYGYSAAKVDAVINYNKETGTLTVEPSSDLEELTEYVFVVKNIEDLAGNKLEENYEVYFTTKKVTVQGPRIVSVYPAEDAVDVEISNPITITFDKKIKYNGLIFRDNIIVKEGETVIPISERSNDRGLLFSLSADGKTLSITRSLFGTKIWTKGETYTVEVKGGIIDELDNPMNEEKIWSFTTIEDDTTAPEIKSISPELGKDIDNPTLLDEKRPSFTVTFNEPLAVNSFGEYSSVGLYYYLNNDTSSTPYKVKDGSNNNAWNVAYDDSDPENVTITFTVTTDLIEGNIYKLDLEAADIQYNYCEDGVFYFKIPSDQTDMVPPTVVSTNPVKTEFADRPTDIDLDINPSVVLSEEIKESTINSDNIYLTTYGYSSAKVDATLSYNKETSTVTLIPNGDLDELTEYAFVIKNIEDLAGNKLEASYDVYFATKKVTTQGPRIVSVYPAEDAVDVDVTRAITITFDKKIKYNGLIFRDNIIVKEGETQIPLSEKSNDRGLLFSLSVDGKTLSITRSLFGSKIWTKGETYTVEVKGGIIDELDNPMNEEKTWSFSTIEDDITPPEIKEILPIVSKDINAPTEIQEKRPSFTVTFNEPLFVNSFGEYSAVGLYYYLNNDITSTPYKVKDGNNNNAWNIVYDESDPENVKITFTVTTDLIEGNVYKLSLPVKDVQFNYCEDSDFFFKIVEEGVQDKPAVESIKLTSGTDTIDLVDGVEDVNKSIDKIEIVFDRAMNEETIKEGANEFIYITAKEDHTQDYTLTSTEVVTENGKTKVTLTGMLGMALTLEPSTKYYLVIPETVKDTENVGVDKTVVGFTTAGEVVAKNKVVKVDVDEVEINTGITVDSPVEVGLNPSKINVLTEKDLAALDVNDGSIRIWEENGTPYGKLVLGATMTIDGSKAILDLSNVELKEGTTYRVQIAEYLEAKDGAALDKEYKFYFKPVDDSGQQLEPAVESVTVISGSDTVEIVDGAVDVSKSIDKIEILFNKAMNEETIKSGYREYIYITPNDDHTQGYMLTSTEVVTENGKTKVTLTGFMGVKLELDPATKYYIVIPETITDSDNNAITKTVIGFTTGGTVLVKNKVVKVDVDNIIINQGITAVSPVEVSLNPSTINVLVEKPLQGIDVNQGTIRVWEENGTSYGKLVLGVTMTIDGNRAVLDLSNVDLKEETTYRVQISDYLTAEDGSGLDKVYSFYFKPVDKDIDYTKGNVLIKGNNIIKKDAVSTLTIETDIQKMSTMDFVLTYDPAQLSAESAVAALGLDETKITIEIRTNESGEEIGEISFKAEFDEDITVSDLMNVTFRSLQGEKSKLRFNEISYVKESIPQIAKGNEFIVMGLTLDLNGDGKVSILDVIRVTSVIGMDSSDSEWDLYKGRDINGDGVIDEADADMISERLGEVVK